MDFNEISGRLVHDLVRDYDLTPEQAAGIAGSLAYETGNFQFMQELKPSVPGTDGGYGFAQWTGGRREKFVAWAADHGVEPSSYDANYGFLKHEIASGSYYRAKFDAVRAAQTAEEAAHVFSKGYLRPNEETANYTKRQATAKQIMENIVPGLTLERTPPNVAVRPVVALSHTLANGAVDPALQMALNARVNAPPMPRPRPERQPVPGNALLTQPGMLERSVAQAQQSTDTGLQAALAARLAPPMPAKPNTAQMAALYSGGGPTRPPMGQMAQAPMPASVEDRVTARNRAQAPTQVASGIGLPPATRMVQSVPMPAPAGRQTYAEAAPTPRSTPRATTIPSSGVVRTASIAGDVPLPPGVRPSVPSTTPAKPQQTELQRQASVYSQGGPTRPGGALPTRTVAEMYAGIYPEQPGDYQIGGNAPNRATTAPYAGIPPAQVAQIGGPVTNQVSPITGRLVAQAGPTAIRRAGAPVPMPASARPTAVATQLAVTPPPPMPIPRPGTGGPVVAQPTVGGVAPVPMPRLVRPGASIGPFQIGGPIGAITGAMNNASGPFNNGANNLLFSILNRGNFVAPEGPNPVSRPSGQFFGGTDTGRSYEAGRLYENGGGTFRANADGSFTNTRTGVISPGSSRRSKDDDSPRIGSGPGGSLRPGDRKYDADKNEWY